VKIFLLLTTYLWVILWFGVKLTVYWKMKLKKIALLSPRHKQYFCTQYWDKKLTDILKKRFFSSKYCMPHETKSKVWRAALKNEEIFFWVNIQCFWENIPIGIIFLLKSWLVKRNLLLKIVKCRDISYLFIAILCAKMSRVTWA